MEFSMEWNVICRVCLQEGDMRSIFDKDEKDLTICDKIVKCSNVTIKRGMNLPEQICNRCLDDLNVAFKFRVNCESSDAILQSFTEGNVVTDLIMSSEAGVVYKYKPPEGLNVKRIRTLPIKLEATTSDTDQNIDNVDNSNESIEHDHNSIIEESHFVDEDENNDEEVTSDQMPTEYYLQKEDETISDDNTRSENRNDNVKFSVKNMSDLVEQQQQTYKRENITDNVYTILPVKTNKARSKAAQSSDIKLVPSPSITTKADGTTVVRLRRAEEQKPLKICEICGNTYKYKHALESHMRRHRNEKPFSCEICGRSFVINFELRRHMRTHTGQKPYACRFCGRRFSDFGSRIKHERTHTGERPYTCDTCGKSFAYSHVLSSHILTHTGEKRYGCSQCGKRFTKSHHLKAHLNTHLKYHNPKPVTVKTEQQTSEASASGETSVIYQSSDKVYEEVLTVLTAQPKIQQYHEEDEIKLIYSE